MEELLKEFIAEISEIKLGDHYCAIYEDKAKQLRRVVEYMRHGLERNEKCVYITDETEKEELISFFSVVNIDINKYLEERQFEFLTKEEAYLKKGYFDPGLMIELLKHTEKEALKDGYSGLRVTGEMTWVFTKLPGTEKLIEYEAKLNYFLPQSKTVALCQYHEQRFKPQLLLDVLHTHPKVVLYDYICTNPYYIPPDEFLIMMKEEIPSEVYERARNEIIERSKIERARKRAEEELKGALDDWNTTFNAISDCICLLDLERRVVQFNEATAKILDVAKNEIKGKLCCELLHGSPQPIEDCPVERMKKTLKREVLEDKLGERWFRIVADPVFDGSGNLQRAVHVISDITERKHAEEAVRESEQKYRGIFNESVAAIYVFDAKKNFIDTNEAGLDLLGYSREELLSMGIPDVDADPEVVLPAHEQLLSGKRLVNYEHKLKRKDGRIITVLNNSRPLTDVCGNVIGMQSTLVDITERKHAEESLRESEEKYKSLFESAGDATFIMDVTEEHGARFLECNDRTLELFGCARHDQIIGKTPVDFSPPVQPDGQSSKEKAWALASTVIEGCPQTFEWVHRRSDGTPFWVEVTLNRIKLKGIFFMQAVVRDITERKKIDGVKSNLIRDVSHSLRTPVAMAQMASDMIRRAIQDKDMDRLSEAHDILNKNIARSRGDIDNVLRLSTAERVEAKEALSLRERLGEALESVKEVTAQKKIKIKVDIPAGAGKIIIGRRDLEVLLNNIIDNAVKFTESGNVTISARPKGKFTELKVSDTGSGISPANIRRVFDRFYRHHIAVPGTGLGLSICKEIADRCGGAIEVVSEGVGKGATVIVRLPRAEGGNDG